MDELLKSAKDNGGDLDEGPEDLVSDTTSITGHSQVVEHKIETAMAGRVVGSLVAGAGWLTSAASDSLRSMSRRSSEGASPCCRTGGKVPDAVIPPVGAVVACVFATRIVNALKIRMCTEAARRDPLESAQSCSR